MLIYVQSVFQKINVEKDEQVQDLDHQGDELKALLSREVTEYKSKISQLNSENRELKDELSHLNEKVIFFEDSNIKLKTKLEELVAETEVLLISLNYFNYFNIVLTVRAPF